MIAARKGEDKFLKTARCAVLLSKVSLRIIRGASDDRTHCFHCSAGETPFKSRKFCFAE